MATNWSVAENAVLPKYLVNLDVLEQPAHLKAEHDLARATARARKNVAVEMTDGGVPRVPEGPALVHPKNRASGTSRWSS